MNEFKIFLSFGEQSKWVIGGNHNDKYSSISEETGEFEFNSKVEMDAFIEGVRAAIGWHDFTEIDEKTFNAIKKAEI